MKKEFAPYELALRLKKLGFDEPCLAVFELIVVGDVIPKFRYNWDSEDKWFDHNKAKDEYEDHDWYWSAPTFSQAFRWLRENYGYEYQITRIVTGSYHALIQSNTDEYLDNLRELGPGICLDEVVDVYTYDDAELECLTKMIKLAEEKSK